LGSSSGDRRERSAPSLWTQGPYDLVSIIDAPSEEAMMGAMANVVAAGNVSSTTMRAFDDKEMEGIFKKV